MGLDIGENIRLAWEGLRANKMRALLTMLGIIIGIGSVIGLLTVGEGLSANITGEMAAMGAGNVTIYFKERDNEFNDNSPFAQQAFGIAEDDYFTDEMFTALMARYPNIVTQIALLEMMPDLGEKWPGLRQRQRIRRQRELPSHERYRADHRQEHPRQG